MKIRLNIIRYQKNYCKLLANSFLMSTKQQITINYIEEISIKSDPKGYNLRYQQKIIISFRPIYLAMITKQQIRINYIEETSIKIHAKNEILPGIK